MLYLLYRFNFSVSAVDLGALMEAAIAALAIVLVGILPVVLLARIGRRDA